jgi:hypothetical protein
VFSLLLYLGGLLLMVIAVNVVLVRMIRAEKRRQDEERRVKGDRKV